MISEKEFFNNGIKIELDKERFLVINFNSIKYMNKNYGDTDQCINKFFEGDIEAFEVMFLSSLLKEEDFKDLSVNELIINFKTMAKAKVALIEALNIFFGTSEGKENDQEKK